MLTFIGFIILIIYISSKASGTKADVIFYNIQQKLSELDKRADELDKRADELDKRTAELDRRTKTPDNDGGYFY